MRRAFSVANIYLFKYGRHDSFLAVLEKLYEIFGISQKFYVPKQTYYPNPKYQSDSFVVPLPSSDTKFCSIFQFACKFSKNIIKLIVDFEDKLD